ncbi:Serine/Threonine kinase domain protein (macronuclear) [Tetrahymena thermophila SB210]|uniref:Serine/Threonine kinase domain protein n=1 Tax=Tetrahymena thermophila (strain SB210) TaxID=312017 RepID=I7MCG0_TETTS|nr:Serine/Threonine kinase domain protein [Tetrahymena thermophila SB210]EAR83825.2 Serine/Threonine kinase domain protein [Tetrahymena thermophila SB210]|eukprot:XP_001031488.2 Serine/Threonine kinase domain protein [Tetrahymena thermophila SB210]
MESSDNICINGYEILLTKGNGNIGSVFQAKKDKEYYAIKMINKNQLESMESFYNLMQKMEHLDYGGNNNVVRIYEFFQNPFNIFISMEYCNQGNLLQYMLKQPEKRLDCFKAIELFAHILNGFKFLHKNNIQHRNLKPQNILMHNNKPKITDYGLYMLYNGKQQYQMREFMAPENYERTSDQGSHLCDIWGLGVLLFFMIFNTWPFKDFDEIKKYTYSKQFALDLFLKEKEIQKPSTLQTNQQAMNMLTEIFQGLFAYQSKNRMSFWKLCNHEIFLKVKNFDMGESILFYFHEEKNFPTINLQQFSPTFKQNGGILNLNGLPGVSARSMYSGEVFDDFKSNENISIMISTPTLQVKKVHSKKCSLSNENQENQELPNQDLVKNQSNIIQQNNYKIPQNQSMNNTMSINLELDSPQTNKVHKKKFTIEEPYSFQNEGGGMLSSFGKRKQLQNLKIGIPKNDSNSPHCKTPQYNLFESDTDFENIEEFDSNHKEANSIPYFTLKACKMVNFQFKPHQDQNAMKMLDSYSLSSVLSIPRPFSFPEADQQKKYISSLYDLEIYRYRFIEQTIHILRNIYQETVNQTPIIDYQLLIKAEHYSLKNAFHIAKTLLQKIEKKENFLKIDSRDFSKYFTQQCHDKYQEILQKDLYRIYIQYFFTQTLLKNQGVEQIADPIENQYFFFKRNSFNQLQEANSIDESENNQSRKGNIFKLQQKQISQASTNNPTLNNHTLQTNIPYKIQDTYSFSAVSKNSPTLAPQQNLSKINLFQNEAQVDLNHQIPQEMECIPNKIQLDNKHIEDLLKKYQQNLMQVFKKLQNLYSQDNGSQEQILKIIKLALRIAMCLRHSEVFEKSQMEQILIYFQKIEKSDSNLLQVVQQPNAAGSSNIIQANTNLNNVGNQNQLTNHQNNFMFNSHQKTSSPSLGTSLANSKNLKKQANSGQMQFSIESLVKWVDFCSKNEALRQISILIKE